MTEPQMQDHAITTLETTEQTRKVWVAPNLMRIPLNEAEAANPSPGAFDALYAFS
jgi:hypothetical protein